MTITFRCPACNGLCGFHDENAGRRARCQKCQEIFIIPSEDGGKALSAEKVEKGLRKPVPYFFQAVFCINRKMFSNMPNIIGLVFVIAAVSFKFFIGHANYRIMIRIFVLYLPIGTIVRVCSWGCIFWYCMEIIACTAMEMDELPEVEIGKGFDFIWNVLKSVYMFFSGLVVSVLPFLAISWLLGFFGIKYRLVEYFLVGVGFFCFPMVILILSAGRDMFGVFRWDWIVLPIVRSIGAYATVACLLWLSAGMFIFGETREYAAVSGGSSAVVLFYLLFNVASVLLLIFSMRAIGLFCRHYNCYMPWA